MGYRERGTINLKCIGLIEKRLVRASDRLSVSMSDNVEHSRLNGLGMRRCSPPPFPSLASPRSKHTADVFPLYANTYTWFLTHAIYRIHHPVMDTNET